MYEFGKYQLDPQRFELRCDSKALSIQPKMLQILLYLVEHRERTVTSEELLKALWPNETVEVGSIKRAVRGARIALGDSGDSQATIRTLRGYGYRFVPPVIVRGRPAGEVERHQAPPPVAAALPAAEPFIGREGVLQTLTGSLQRALAGTPTCVLISGAPGLGKTRTIEELLSRARALGADTWLGRCTDVEGAPAYWPFIQVLREAARTRGAAEFRTLLGAEGADVLDSMRELRRELPEVPETTQLASASARFRLFDGVSVFLQRAAERRPIVIALDDIHCADAASLHLLSFLVQQVQRARLLFVASHRPTAAATMQPLAQSSHARCLELSGWDEREIACYVELATGSAPSDELRTRLLERTAGNPLFVQQAIERGAELPAAVSPIDQHLALVSPGCRELLGAAAVCGPEFSDALLASVANTALDLVREQLAHAEACGLISTRSGSLPRYGFTHGLIREALYARVPPSQRAMLHGRAARTIELHGVDDSAVRLAELTHHYACAAPAHDAGRALEYLVRSAEAARAALAYEQTAEYFEQALQLLQYRPTDPALRMRLQFGRAEALLRAGARAHTRSALLDVIGLANEAGDLALQVAATALFASPPESGSVDDTQVQLLEQAIERLPQEDARLPWLEALLAKSLSYAANSTRRVQLARQARARSHERPNSELRLETLSACHQALLGPDHLDERTEIAGALLELAHERGSADALLSAYAARVETCAAIGDIDGLEAAASSLHVLAEQVRDPVARWHVALLACMRATLRSDIDAAHAHAEAALHSGTPLDAELARRVYSVQSNLLLRLTGRTAEAEALMRAMALRYPNVYGWTASVGAIDWELGRRDEARSCLARLIDRGLERVRSEPYLLSGFTAVSDLCCRVGDAAAATAIYRALLPYAEQHGITHLAAVSYGPMSNYLGLLAECRGDFQLAEQHFVAALAAAERSPQLLTIVRVGYARTLLRAGGAERRDRAATLLAQAWKHASEQRLHGVASLCGRVARRHGLPPFAASASLT